MASLLDMLAPWLRVQMQQPQMQDRVVSAQPQGGANMSGDTSMLRGMPQGSSYAQQLQDPNQWNLGGSPTVPDYSRITTPGNPGGPSYNANYGQTSYPGSTVGSNPQGPMVPPGNRGLAMASDMMPHARQQHGTGRSNTRPVTGPPVPASEQLKQWLLQYQQRQGINPGPIRHPAMDL